MAKVDAEEISDAMRKPFKFFGITWAPLSLPFERRIQTFCVWIHINYLSFTPYIIILGNLYLLWFGSLLWKMIPLLYVTWFAITFGRMEEGGETLMCVNYFEFFTCSSISSRMVNTCR